MTERRRGETVRAASSAEPPWLDFVPLCHQEHVVDGRQFGRAERWLLLRPHSGDDAHGRPGPLRGRRRMIVVVRLPTTAHTPSPEASGAVSLATGFNPYYDVPPT